MVVLPPRVKKQIESRHELKRELYKKRKHCFYCGIYFKHWWKATLEHLYPVSKGGRNKIGNYTLSCRRCNIRKGNQIIGLNDYRKKYGIIEVKVKSLDRRVHRIKVTYIETRPLYKIFKYLKNRFMKRD